MNERTSPFAKRIAPQLPGGRAAPGGRILALRLLPVVFVVPALMTLTAGRGVALLALLAGTALVVAAGVLVRRGLDASADYERRRIAAAPPPYRLAGALAVGLAFLLVGWFAARYGPLTGIVLGALGTAATVVTYGLDPRAAKGLDAAAATGVRGERLIEAIREAEDKLAEIERSAAALRNREFGRHLGRIVGRARAVLDEIERDPKDLARARRFLNIYLDGTRNVVRDFARRQDDFADTPVAQNFKNVLGTIERVFDEQVAHLRKDEALDLDVAIEVLNTQLTKEGVG
ncbi:MAG: hypothetical protein GVY33_17020 [Alphaproteobacteria bacterium]|nr:hypothetical protein [Alphaproteobacteria bacterium]